MELRRPLPQKRVDQIPLIVYRDGDLLFEVTNFQEAVKRLKPMVSCTLKKLQDAIWNGAFKDDSWLHSGYKYDFRTTKERQVLGVIKRKVSRK